MAPKLSQVRAGQLHHMIARMDAHSLYGCPQEEFDEAVKTNMEDFDMEVCDQSLLLLLQASMQRAKTRCTI